MIRLFEFIKSADKQNKNLTPGMYIALGNFDYLSTWHEDWSEEKQVEIISDPSSYAIKNGGSGYKGERAYIVGFREDSKRIDDVSFWNDHSFPFVFITSINLNTKIDIKKSIQALEKKMNRSYGLTVRIAPYSTLDESDMLICLKTKQYNDGYRCIMKFNDIIRNKRNHNVIGRGLTTINIDPRCSLTEEDEYCNISLRIKVENENLFSRFLPMLQKRFEGKTVEQYGLFGVEDKIIYIKDISVNAWRELYVGKKTITAQTEIRKYGIQDIRTEILEHG